MIAPPAACSDFLVALDVLDAAHDRGVTFLDQFVQASSQLEPPGTETEHEARPAPEAVLALLPDGARASDASAAQEQCLAWRKMELAAARSPSPSSGSFPAPIVLSRTYISWRSLAGALLALCARRVR